MNWDAIGAVGELVGGLLVLVSLVYLAAQIRQTNRLAEADAERETLDSYSSMLARIVSNPEVIVIGQRAFTDWRTLLNKEKAQFHHLTAPIVNHLDTVLRLHEKGLISRELRDLFGNLFLSMVTSPGGKQWWAEVNGAFPASCREYVARRLRETPDWPALTDVMPFWKPDPKT